MGPVVRLPRPPNLRRSFEGGFGEMLAAETSGYLTLAIGAHAAQQLQSFFGTGMADHFFGSAPGSSNVSGGPTVIEAVPSAHARRHEPHGWHAPHVTLPVLAQVREPVRPPSEPARPPIDQSSHAQRPTYANEDDDDEDEDDYEDDYEDEYDDEYDDGYDDDY